MRQKGGDIGKRCGNMVVKQFVLRIVNSPSLFLCEENTQ
jgi:hypothetical protein